MLESAAAEGQQHFVLLFHCFSAVKAKDDSYDRIRPDRLVIWRFEKLLRFLAGLDPLPRIDVRRTRPQHFFARGPAATASTTRLNRCRNQKVSPGTKSLLLALRLSPGRYFATNRALLTTSHCLGIGQEDGATYLIVASGMASQCSPHRPIGKRIRQSLTSSAYTTATMLFRPLVRTSVTEALRTVCRSEKNFRAAMPAALEP